MSYEQLRSNMDGIVEIDWSLIIFDEAHRLEIKDQCIIKTDIGGFDILNVNLH